MKRLLSLFFIFSVLTGNGQNANSYYNKGQKYYKSADWELATGFFRKAAAMGHAESQLMLGQCYYQGRGVEQDYAQAAHWYQKAAEQGNPKAQCNMGVLLLYGHGVERDRAKAFRWFDKAVKGDADYKNANYYLGFCHEHGWGTAQNYDLAKKYYKIASDLGHVNAANRMAAVTTKQSDDKKKPQVAQQQPKPQQAQPKQQPKQQSGQATEQKKSSGQSFGEYMAERWNKSQADAYANADPADKYYTSGISKSLRSSTHAESAALFRKAADMGHMKAQFELGECYMYGKGVEKDMDQAIYWYGKSAEQGYAVAQYELGQCYFDKRNYEQAFRWFYKSANQDFTKAQTELGVCYYVGYGTESNNKQAVYWWKKAAAKNDSFSMLLLCRAYVKGEGVPKDRNIAEKYYNQAIMQDDYNEWLADECYDRLYKNYTDR